MAQANPFTFSNKYQDQETGLLYYGYRYYQPQTGRWLSRDPIGEWGGANLFTFGKNNPLSWIDPFGLFDVKIDEPAPVRDSKTNGGATDAFGVKLSVECKKGDKCYKLTAKLVGPIKIVVNSNDDWLNKYWRGYDAVVNHEEIHRRAYKRFFNSFASENAIVEKVNYADSVSCEAVKKKLIEHFNKEFERVHNIGYGHKPGWNPDGTPDPITDAPNPTPPIPTPPKP